MLVLGSCSLVVAPGLLCVVPCFLFHSELCGVLCVVWLVCVVCVLSVSSGFLSFVCVVCLLSLRGVW